MKFKFKRLISGVLMTVLVKLASGSATENDSSICHQPPERGLCRANMFRWMYDYQAKVCHQFSYGGCGGNENNFYTRDECMRRCSGV